MPTSDCSKQRLKKRDLDQGINGSERRRPRQPCSLMGKSLAGETGALGKRIDPVQPRFVNGKCIASTTN